jgi:hypothetical protein
MGGLQINLTPRPVPRFFHLGPCGTGGTFPASASSKICGERDNSFAQVTGNVPSVPVPPFVPVPRSTSARTGADPARTCSRCCAWLPTGTPAGWTFSTLTMARTRCRPAAAACRWCRPRCCTTAAAWSSAWCPARSAPPNPPSTPCWKTRAFRPTRKREHPGISRSPCHAGKTRWC